MDRGDLNGTGRWHWTFEDVGKRYRRYCRRFGVADEPLEVHPYYVERGWLSSIINVLILRMRKGDLAAAHIGLELIEEDRGFFCGSIIKSNVGRALGRCALTEPTKLRVRQRVSEMLIRKFLPKEFRQYAWLCRRIGLGDSREYLERRVDRTDAWVRWYMKYLIDMNPPLPPNRGGLIIEPISARIRRKERSPRADD